MRLTPTRASLTQTLEGKNALIASLQASLADAQNQQTGDDSQVLHTSRTVPDAADKDILKVYMRNQLDLQESEWEQYEATVNELAAQLELAQEELAAAQTERDGLQEEVEGWKGSCAAKAEEGLLLASDLSKVQAQLVDAQNEILQLKSVRQILWVWSCVTSPEEY